MLLASASRLLVLLLHDVRLTRVGLATGGGAPLSAGSITWRRVPRSPAGSPQMMTQIRLVTQLCIGANA